jgi:hypothetical protein
VDHTKFIIFKMISGTDRAKMPKWLLTMAWPQCVFNKAIKSRKVLLVRVSEMCKTDCKDRKTSFNDCW